jgi:hypothetical protein
LPRLFFDGRENRASSFPADFVAAFQTRRLLPESLLATGLLVAH